MKTRNPLFFLLLLSLSIMCSCKLFQPVPSDPPQEINTETETTAKGTAQFDYWMHAPLHPDNNSAVTFKSKIKEPAGILTIELHVYEFELYLNDDELPSKQKRTRGQWGLVKTWEGNGQQEMTLNHRYAKGFPKHSQVEYIFKVIDLQGNVSERLAIFDAGTSPWPQDKILLYSACRVDLTETFNLCFFPDVDFKKDWKDFLEDTHKLIFDGFHESNVMNDRKERWTFYYTKQEADGLKIAQEFTDPKHYPEFMKSEMITGIDAFGLLHKKPYSDGAYLYGNIHFLAQNVFTAESYNHGTAIHEMGHAVFQLSDEYNGCACFQPTEGFSNVFETKKECLDFQKSQGLVNQECHELYGFDLKPWFTPEKNVYFETKKACVDYNDNNGFTNAECITFIDVDGQKSYRSEGGVCIMNDDGDSKLYSFQESCMTVVNDYYSRFGEKLFVSTGAPKVLSENMFGYEPVVYMSMKEQNGEWSAAVDKIAYGIPAEKKITGNGAVLKFRSNNSSTKYELAVNHPGEIHFCGGTKGLVTMKAGPEKCMFAVPYDKDLEDVVVESKEQIKKPSQCINLSKGLKKAEKGFKKRR
ncbi:MAG: hypothetical protein AB8F74_08975 [Saprospiraceae bacterium]